MSLKGSNASFGLTDLDGSNSFVTGIDPIDFSSAAVSTAGDVDCNLIKI